MKQCIKRITYNDQGGFIPEFKCGSTFQNQLL